MTRSIDRCAAIDLALSPSLADGDARRHLDLLVTPGRTASLHGCIRRLQRRFQVYAATCPVPLPAPGLVITPEIRYQSELYLPIAEVAAVFHRLYRTTLTYPPILESTPFHAALSWADLFVALPPPFQSSANPAQLLEQLLCDSELLEEFLFASFLPRRFYGGFRRYPRQREFVRAWLNACDKKILRCLDAASGTGEDSYGMALLLLENGYHPAQLQIEGWTLEPLEVWSAAHASFPHDPERQAVYRRETETVFTCGAAERLRFRTVDLRKLSPEEPGMFDLILCNGLLGGPILNDPGEVQRVAAGLAGLLAPRGMLLTADSFHGGWKQKHPQDWLRVQLESLGLVVSPAGEGLSACT